MNDKQFVNRALEILAVLLVVSLGACIFVCTASATGTSRLQAMVSILPLKYFVERIGGERVDVSVMVAPGANPATYEPRPRQMAVLSRAEIYFAIGVPFEKTWLPRFERINPAMEIIPVQKGIKLYPISGDTSPENQWERRGFSPTMMDPHIWLSPPLVMLQARNILDALLEKRPKDSSYFQARYLDFIEQIAQTDLKIMNMFQSISSEIGRQRAFMVYHPCWGYFARAYGLRQIAIEEKGREPKPARLVTLAKMAKRLGIKTILIQPQYSKKSAEAVADSIGATLLPADPLAYEWDKNLLSVARKIKENLR